MSARTDASVVKWGRSWTYVLYLGRDDAGRKRQKWAGGFRTRHAYVGITLDTYSHVVQGMQAEAAATRVAGLIFDQR